MQTNKEYYAIIARKNEALNLLTKKKKMIEDNPETFNMVKLSDVTNEDTDSGKINISDIAKMLHFSVEDITKNNTTCLLVSVNKGTNLNGNTLKAMELLLNTDQSHQESLKEKNKKIYNKLIGVWDKLGAHCLPCLFVHPVEMKKLAWLDTMAPAQVFAEMNMGLCVNTGQQACMRAIDAVSELDKYIELFRMDLAKDFYVKAISSVQKD